MVKKINQDGVAIKKLYQQGYSQAQIMKILNLKKTKVNYWIHTPLKTTQEKKKKLDDKYMKKIYELGKDKPISEMSGEKIKNIINEELKKDNVLDKKGKQITISKRSVCRFLKKKYKIRKKIRTCYLTKEQKKKRLNFVKK